MGLLKKGGRWSFYKRVPKRFRHLDKRKFVRIALNTDSKSEAMRKAPQVESRVMAHWEALAAGQTNDARAAYDAATALAEAWGVRYVPGDVLAAGPLQPILDRLAVVAQAQGAGAEPKVLSALVGDVPAPLVTITEALDEFFDLTTDRLAGKSETQIHKWRLPRLRAVSNFVEVIADRPMDEITREDALNFRRWWRDRIEADSLNPSSANKDFGHLSDVFRTWCEMKARDLDNPFARLRFKETSVRESFPFSVDWITNNLLAPEALDGLNQAARNVLIVMINTGARPSEIIDALPEDFAVTANTPHLQIRARDDRTLKTNHSRRDIPLLGVSLEAARALATAGGCGKYRGKADRWSATVNKYLAENGLRETPNHTAYSLRHAFEDRLLEAGVDERLRIELMGHKYHRPTYGKGGSMEVKRDAVARIAI